MLTPRQVRASDEGAGRTNSDDFVNCWPQWPARWPGNRPGAPGRRKQNRDCHSHSKGNSISHSCDTIECDCDIDIDSGVNCDCDGDSNTKRDSKIASEQR